MNLYDFLAQNPVLSILLALIISETIVRAVVALALALHSGKEESDE